MSILDRLVAAVTPLENDEERLKARENARTQAAQDGIVQLIIDDHNRIEQAFEAVRSATTAEAQRAAELEMATLLNGHSVAEEAAVYPELVEHGQQGHAMLGYEEQAATKVQLALLAKLEPLSKDYMEKLAHIRGAVTHHMFQEENSWLIDLERRLLSDAHDRVIGRYIEEMSRYAAPPRDQGQANDARSVMSWGAERDPASGLR